MENDTAYAFKYGIDIAKDVFQLFRVDQESGEVQNFKLKRKDLIAEFINRGKCLIGMEDGYRVYTKDESYDCKKCVISVGRSGSKSQSAPRGLCGPGCSCRFGASVREPRQG